MKHAFAVTVLAKERKYSAVHYITLQKYVHHLLSSIGKVHTKVVGTY